MVYFINIMHKKSRLRLNIFFYKYFHVYLFFSFVINILNWIVAYYIVANASSNLIILHYNVDFGADLIGEIERIYTIPIVGLIIILINLILVFTFHKKGGFIANSLLLSALIGNVFLLIALGALYLVNFR